MTKLEYDLHITDIELLRAAQSAGLTHAAIAYKANGMVKHNVFGVGLETRLTNSTSLVDIVKISDIDGF